MKQTIKLFRYNKVFNTLLVLLIMQQCAIAQTLVTPSKGPTGWYKKHTTITGLNSAELYGVYPAPIFGGTLVFGSVYWDGTNAQFMVNDWGAGAAGLTSPASTPTGLPDIVIGNTASGTQFTDYTVAVAYPTATGLEVDCFDFYDNGVTTSISGPTCKYTYTTAGTVSTVHLDINVDYSNTSVTGHPYSQYAFVTWDDLSTGSVYADHIDLQASGSLTLSPTTIGTGQAPDVAGIFRGSIAPGDEVALITYTDAANTNLYYQEWDFTTSTVSGVTTMDALPAASTVSIPRIDANDDYQTNAPGNGVANYEIVAQVYNNSSGFSEIRTYNDLLGALNPYTSSNAVTFLPAPCNSVANYNNYTPTVALGGTTPMGYYADGTEYLVAHFTDDGGSPNDIVFMEPIDYTTGNIITPPNQYYWVSEDAASMLSTSGAYAASVSTPINIRAKNSILVWSYPLAPGVSVVEYKISGYPYAYKNSNATKAAAIQNQPISLYPNPAKDILVVDNVDPAQTTGYVITNMLGVSVASGTLDKVGRVNIDHLAPGSYILKLQYNDNSMAQGLFAKY